MPVDDDAVADVLAKTFPANCPGDPAAAAKARAGNEAIVARVANTLNTGKPAAPAITASGAAVTYYKAHATHARQRPASALPNKPFHQFTGRLPLVRFALPETGDLVANVPPDIDTDIGLISAADRKIASVAMVEELTGRNPARVDLITPPRALGMRFGAIALYLCYDTADSDRPSFYILEAGTGTGTPMVLFLSGLNMGDIVNKHSGYEPTAFAETTDFYSGQLVMDPNAPDEPKLLTILSTNTNVQGGNPGVGNTPYIKVSVRYERLTTAQGYDPLKLILEAGARASIIGSSIGIDAGFTENIANMLVGWWALDWDKEPE